MHTIKMICFKCNKKFVILIQCKCEQSYCIKHQLPEKHNCTYIYKKHIIEPVPSNKKIDTI